MTREEKIQFIRDNYLKMSGAEMARRIGWGKHRVYYVMKKEGLRAPKALHVKWRSEKNRRPMTPEEDDFIRRHTLAGQGQKWISEQLGRSGVTISKRQKELGLQNAVQRNARQSHYKKGITVWNKGLPRSEWNLSPEAEEAMKRGQFSAGMKPHNTLSDGVITIRRHKGRRYKHIRLSEGHWVHYHRYLWEQAHGPIPKGYNVVFRDGDTMNCTLENLELISREKNMIRNSKYHYPPEVVDTVVLHAKLKKKIKQKRKKT